MSNFDIDTQSTWAQELGISRYQQITLARLARDFPILHEGVKAGNLTVHRASINEGFVREAPPWGVLKHAWGKASLEEQESFLVWVTVE